ncbi:hypothetical protein HDK64DRAFT_258882 [Phyllosticta capitalensis]
MVDRNLSAPVRPLQAHHSLTSPFNVSQLRLLIRRRSLLWNLPNLRCRRGFCFQFTAASTKTPCAKAQYVKLTDRTIAFKFDSLKDAERAVKHPNPAIARETLDLLGPSELMKTSEWSYCATALEFLDENLGRNQVRALMCLADAADTIFTNDCCLGLSLQQWRFGVALLRVAAELNADQRGTRMSDVLCPQNT